MKKKSALESKQDAILDKLDEDLGPGAEITKKEFNAEDDEDKPAMQYKSAMSREKEEAAKRASDPKNSSIQDIGQDHPEKDPSVGRIVHYFVKQYDHQGRSVLQARAAIVTEVLKDDTMKRVGGINISHFTPRGDLHPRHQVHFSSAPAEGKWSWPKHE